MTRMWVVLGDATTSGGQVISGSPFTDVDGHILSEASIVSVPWGWPSTAGSLHAVTLVASHEH